MEYNNVHRFLLRTVASRGVMSIDETKRAVCVFAGVEILDTSSITDMVKAVNDQIKPYNQMIKITTDELTDEEVVIFLSLGYDEATKAQNFFTATELEFFRVLIEQIMTTETRQVTAIRAINMVNQLKSSFTKTDAQKLLKTWCNMKYLAKDEEYYALGVRAINEFEGYLRQNMPDTIEECCLCKKIVFRGYNCPGCAKAVHTRCLNHYLESVAKWPCCKVDFNTEQLERLHSQSSRLIQTQASESQSDIQDTQLDATAVIEESQNSQVDDMSQDIIPEISQRITRKRKRD